MTMGANQKANEILDRVVSELMREFYGRVEERIRALLIGGVSVTEITVRYEGDRLQLWISDIPDSEFWIKGTKSGVSVNGRSIRAQEDGRYEGEGK
jgi:hypothetical protein